MFDETLVVQSALSAFNNAALVAPTFFWTGLLAVPLMALAYFYGKDFVRRIGWRDGDVMKNASVMTAAVTVLWLLLFGGNYDVLRDTSSFLAFGIAAAVFTGALMVGAASRGLALPRWRGTSWRHRFGNVIGVMAIVGVAAMSAMPKWWAILMQVAALFGGVFIGRVTRRDIPDTALATVIAGLVGVLMLMQPEFFRFGKLGALSIVHIAVLVLLAASVAATLALRNVAPRGRIHHSAYVKLKCLGGFMVALGVVMFMMTESVPVLLGAGVAMYAMFAISVWHANGVPKNMAARMFAVMLGLFGLLTGLPVISALGVLVWVTRPCDNFWAQARFLL